MSIQDDTPLDAFLGSLTRSACAIGRGAEDGLAHFLGYGESRSEREQMKQATATGAAGLIGVTVLLGTRMGRGLLWNGGVLLTAGLLGKAAIDAGRAALPSAEARASLLAALIARVKGSREMTEAEVDALQVRLDAMPRSVRDLLLARTADRLLSAEEIAELAEDAEARRELYSLAAFISGDSAPTPALDSLAQALGISEHDARSLRHEAARF